MNNVHSNDHNGIAVRAMSGGVTILVGRFVIKAVDLIVLFVLARLLPQSAFGLVGLAMTFVVVAEAILELQLTQLLVREKSVSREMLDTVFTLSFIRGMFLAVILFGMALPISFAYGEPRLTALIGVLAMAPAFRGSQSPAMVFFIKKMNFRWEIILEGIGKLVGGTASIFIALMTESYWSIVIAVVAPPIVMNLVSYLIAPYRPKFSMSQWHVFSNFIGWVTLTQMAKAVNWQIDKLVLGYFLAPVLFGKYSVAKDLSNSSEQTLFPPLFKPLLSACSEAHLNSMDLGLIYQKACRAMLLIVGPVLLTMGVLSSQVVVILLGQGWEETGWIFRWFCAALIISSMHRPVESLAIALSQNKRFAKQMMVTVMIRLLMVCAAGIAFSYQGAVLAIVLSEIIAFAFMTGLGCSLTNMRFVDIVWSFRSTVAALAMMGACLYFFSPAVVPEHGSNSTLLRLVFVVILSFVVYTFCVILFWKCEGSPPGPERILLNKAVALIKLYTRTSRIQ